MNFLRLRVAGARVAAQGAGEVASLRPPSPLAIRKGAGSPGRGMNTAI